MSVTADKPKPVIPIPKKSVLSEAQKLAKLSKTNPALYDHLQSQNLIPIASGSSLSKNAFAEDDKFIKMYAKKLGIKKNKMPKSFTDDGLDCKIYFIIFY